jgi:hypothetical protein
MSSINTFFKDLFFNKEVFCTYYGIFIFTQKNIGLGINFSTAISIAYKISNSLNGFNKKLNGCVSLALSKFACPRTG